MLQARRWWIPGYRLRSTTVPGGAAQPVVGRLDDLHQHLAMLTTEFAGTSELELLHARTIVFLRRGLDVHRNRARFRRLWFWHGAFLCERLNSRWLISAADTFIDHPRSPAEQATALAGVLLASTVKLYESERLQLGHRSAAPLPISLGDPQPLFDGLTTYLVGRGDLLSNLRHRLNRVSRRGRPANLILAELMRRLERHDTIYSRMH